MQTETILKPLQSPPVPRVSIGATDFHRPIYCLFGIPFERIDAPEVVERLGRAVRERTRVVMSTPNVNNVVAMSRDARFRESVLRCELIVPDGMPLVWIARLLGIPSRRVAGSDVFEALMAGEGGPLRTYFFGGPEGVAQAAAERLNQDGGPMQGAGGRYPGFGTVSEMAALDVVEGINATRPDFVVVALGTAKGQQWIDRVGAHVDAPVISHLGAVVNFVAGSVRRAPMWMQQTGLEWLWRIREEPALWRRYAQDGVAFARICAREVLPLLAQRLGRALRPVRSSAALAVAPADGGKQRLTLAGDWVDADLHRLRDALTQLVQQPSDVDVEVNELGRVDHGFIGLLVKLYGHQQKHGRTCRVVQPSAALARQLRWHGAAYLMDER